MDSKSYIIRLPKRWVRIAMTTGVVALIVVALTAVASDTFNDVESSHTFHDNIAWLESAGITKGCNPPDNNLYCPDDNVTRGQMAAFFERFADYLGAEDGTPAQADDADTVDGKHAVGAGASSSEAEGKLVALDGEGVLPDKFLPSNLINEDEWNQRTETIVTTAGPAGWVTTTGTDPGTFGTGYFDTTSSGLYLMAIPGVQQFGDQEYGLEQVEICYDGDAAGNGITHVEVWGAGTNGSLGDSELAEDTTDRLTEGCFIVPVNAGVPYGANVVVTVNAAGVDLGAVKAWWERGITAVPTAASGDEDDE